MHSHQDRLRLNRHPSGRFDAIFGRVRRRSLDLLRGLPASDWERELVDPAQGRLTVLELCEQVMRHELGHLSQVRNLLTLLPDQ